ncbi:MAG: hypothetical protein U5K77_00510 [Candidatus Saccharibacteria bacterium]|nr:hypothetical protein [Candidatus Saccharibacteria bacterium]
MSGHLGVTVDKLILVAPWTDPNKKYGDFFDTKINPNMAQRCLGGISVFYSSLDDEQAKQSLEVVRQTFDGRDDVEFIDIPDYGHYMLGNTMKTEEFPELIDKILEH